MVKSKCSIEREDTFVKEITKELCIENETELGKDEVKVRVCVQKVSEDNQDDHGVIVTEVDSGASNLSTPIDYNKFLYDYEEGDDSPRAEPEMYADEACVNQNLFQTDVETPQLKSEDLSESGIGITEDRIREIFLTSYSTEEMKKERANPELPEEADNNEENSESDESDPNDNDDEINQIEGEEPTEEVEEFDKTKKLEEKLNKALENIEKEEVEVASDMSEEELEELKEKCMSRLKNAEQLCEYAEGPSIKDFSSSKRLLDYLEKSVEKDEQTKSKVKTAAYSIKPDVPRMGDLLAKSVADLSEEILKLNLELEEEKRNNETLRVQFDQTTKVSGDTLHQLNKEHALKLEAQKKQYQV